MIFRWSIWGQYKETNLDLLRYSILSFKKQFGNKHRYVIYTDSPSDWMNKFNGIAEVLDFTNIVSEYDIDSVATWKKWCPSPRIDVNETEVYIDSDVFLLRYPKEIDDFIKDSKSKFGIMDEFFGQLWQYGAMQQKADKQTPFVNAGLFIQKAGYNISQDLSEELNWWKKNISKDNQTHHDEQGALAIALTRYSINGELYIFPKEKYMLIGPNENADIEDLDEVTMFHAVYPDHPAFYKFKHYLDDLLK